MSAEDPEPQGNPLNPSHSRKLFISYAQNAEDVLLWRALQHVEHGFYIDVGGYDPVEHSITQAFYERGWNGINIEPVPSNHEKFATQRVRDINLKVAVSDICGTMILHEIKDTGLSTLIDDHAQKYTSEGWLVIDHATPVLTLAEICKIHVNSPIHFLKIDVEGSEQAVLKGADFSQFRPWLILIEATMPNSKAENHSTWEPGLLAQGYVFLYFDGLNRYYSSIEHAEQMRPHFTTQVNPLDWFVLHSHLQLHEAANCARIESAAAAAALEALKLEHTTAVNLLGKLQVEHEKLITGHEKLQMKHAKLEQKKNKLEQRNSKLQDLVLNLQNKRIQPFRKVKKLWQRMTGQS